MGVSAGAGRGGRRPSHVAYYVALFGILALLLLLVSYFFYYFVKKVIELRQVDALTQTPASSRPPAVPAYPVQPVVRDSASAMAKLCKQLPAPPNKGGTVFPTSTSPAAQQTDTGDHVDRGPLTVERAPLTDKTAIPVLPAITVETQAVR